MMVTHSCIIVFLIVLIPFICGMPREERGREEHRDDHPRDEHRDDHPRDEHRDDHGRDNYEWRNEGGRRYRMEDGRRIWEDGHPDNWNGGGLGNGWNLFSGFGGGNFGNAFGGNNYQWENDPSGRRYRWEGNDRVWEDGRRDKNWGRDHPEDMRAHPGNNNLFNGAHANNNFGNSGRQHPIEIGNVHTGEHVGGEGEHHG